MTCKEIWGVWIRFQQKHPKELLAYKEDQMDFKLSEELQALRETARDFAEKEIIPYV